MNKINNNLIKNSPKIIKNLNTLNKICYHTVSLLDCKKVKGKKLAKQKNQSEMYNMTQL